MSSVLESANHEVVSRSGRKAVPELVAEDLRDVYANQAMPSVARILSLMDRNEFSPTYGCIDREYWLCRTTDFPSAIAQFGVHALALCWAHPMLGNIYHQQPKVLHWTLAGMDYLTRIQHRDGSFDEFYPNERGWAGPTGFLVYAMLDSYQLLQAHIPGELRERFLKMIERAAVFLYKHDESGVLANHHAMAILPIYYAYHVLGEKHILDGFHVRLDDFLGYVREEGWCLEYDGTDLGYLSATVSFLAKLRKMYQDERIDRVLGRAIEFSSYFIYPNGHYAGSIGSRSTLHFYPHGYELLGHHWPLAHAAADAMLRGLAAGALVPPNIQEDRYFLYRTPELLLSYVDYQERADDLPPLPYQREPFVKAFPDARCFVRKTRRYYLCANLAKGGLLKVFDNDTGKLVCNDAGLLAELESGQVATSQWIDEDRQVSMSDDELVVEGATQCVVTKRFTPIKFLLFRLWILAIGWHTGLAYRAKGLIRRLLMLGAKKMPLSFRRRISMDDRQVTVTTQVTLRGTARVRRLRVGDEFHVRYVPQSRYFQPQELSVSGKDLTDEQLDRLNSSHPVTVQYDVFGDEPVR
jgi:hypothetical protein